MSCIELSVHKYLALSGARADNQLLLPATSKEFSAMAAQIEYEFDDKGRMIRTTMFDPDHGV